MYQRTGKLVNQKFREFLPPTILMSMAVCLGIVVDAVLVGNILGEAAMAAVSLVAPVTYGIQTLYVWFGMGGATIAAIAKGRREEKEADQFYTASAFLLVFFGILMTALGLLFSDSISAALSGGNTLMPLVKEYVTVYFCGSMLFLFVSGMVYFAQIDGRAKLASLTLILSNVVNLVMDIVFMKGFGMGIAGAALASVTGYLVGFIVLLTYLLSRKKGFRVRIADRKGAAIRAVLKAGAPGAVGSGLLFFKTFCLNLIVLSVVGKEGAVAFSVCTSSLAFASMFVMGVSQTIIPIVGALYGEGDDKGIRILIRKSMMIVLCCCLLSMAVMELAPFMIMKLFGVSRQADIAIGVEALRIFAFSLPFMGYCTLCMYYFQTTKRTAYSMVISLLRGFLLIVPSAYIFGRIWGSQGIWFAFAFADGATCLLTFAISAWIRCRRARPSDKDPGAVYESVFLLKKEQPGEKLYDVTVRTTMEDAVELSRQVIDFTSQNGVETDKAKLSGLMAEEIINNLRIWNEKPIDVDVVLRIESGWIYMNFRDAGKPFDVLSYQKQEKDYMTDSISLMKNMADDISYLQVIGLNNSSIRMRTGT